MIFTNLFAAAALLCSIFTAALPAPQTSYGSGTVSPNQHFNLQPIITAGDSSIFPSRLYVTTQHTGAGTSAAVAVTNQTIAGDFSINNTYLGLQGGTPSIPYTFGLSPYAAVMSNAPPSYDTVVIDAGLLTPGFSLDPGNYVQYTGNQSFTTFALCSVNGTAPYFSLGSDYQVFWKNSSSAPMAQNCADIKLQASFVSSSSTPS